MKRLVLLATMFISLTMSAQTLTVPTSQVLLNDTNALGANMYLEFTNWTISSQLVSLSTNNGNSVYRVSETFSPENSQLNELVQIGGDVTEWQLYFRVVDSTFFQELVPSSDTLSGNIEKVLGRNTITRKTWGAYFDNNFEIYHNTFNGDYIIAARDDNGNRLKLSTVLKIRNRYAQITGYYTPYSFSQINQNNLERRGDEW